MKTVSLLFSFLLITSLSFSQSHSRDYLFKTHKDRFHLPSARDFRAKQMVTNYLDSIEYQSISSGSLDNIVRALLDYDSLNRISKFYVKDGEHPDSMFVIGESYFHYTQNNVSDSVVDFNIDSSGTKTKSAKTIYYGGLNQPDSTEYFNWNDSTLEWKIRRRQLFYISSKIDSVYFISYNSGTSDLYQIDKYYYNAQLNLVKDIEGYTNTGYWVPNYGTEYYYNSTGTRYDSLQQGSLDSLGNCMFCLNTQFTYDVNNNPIIIVVRDTFIWGNGNKTEINFRTDLLKSETNFPRILRDLLPYGYEFALNPIAVDSSYRFYLGSWILQTVGKFYYSQRQPVAVESFDDIVSLKVYPNPVNQKLSILSSETLNKVEIHDLLGSDILSKLTDSNKLEFDLSTIPNGVYLLSTLSEKGTHQTQKIIIQH